jgi:prepilin-type N-terminal cleavage/methylation domain-containing protein
MMVVAKGSRPGFTLVELVTTAAIFGILGAMLLGMVRSSMDMWTRGESQREEMERSTTVLETITDELRMVFTENTPLGKSADVRFFCDFVDFDCDGDGTEETRLQRLRFVRINREERENLELRTAGDLPVGRKYFALTPDRSFDETSGQDRGWVDEDDAEQDVYRPTGGLAEALFTTFPPVFSRKVRINETLILYRGYRSPIGGEDSFFAPGLFLKPSEISATLVPVAGGVLHLEFRFFDQETESFNEKENSPDESGGAGYTWDSTRGILPLENEERQNTFRFAAGPASRDDSSDDIFPSRVLVTVVVAAGGRPEGVGRLVDDVKEIDSRISVDLVRPFQNWVYGEKYVRIGSEWIRFSKVVGNELIVEKRGARNTIPAAHKAGCPLFVGRAFSTQVVIPARKECWNEIGE